MLSPREVLLAIFEEALRELDPEQLVAAALADDGRAATVVAIGKAAEAMLAGAERALAARVIRSVCVGPTAASHPIPDQRSVEAGEALLDAARLARIGERFIALVSGGGSSLAVGLPAGITLEDKREATRMLLARGASIEQINRIRCGLSTIKGGRLAVAAAPAEIETLVLCDVVSGELGAVASGPTIASRWPDAAALAARFGLSQKVSAFLSDGGVPSASEVPGRLIGLADNRELVLRAAAAATRRGLFVNAIAEPLVGECADVARALIACADASGPGVLVVAGGEPTPTLGDSPGRGGRAQEVALQLAFALDGRAEAAALAIGSDGVDGPFGGAGGFADANARGALVAAGIEPAQALASHDSGTALAAISALVPAQPTGTNLADLFLVWTGGAKLR